MIKPELIMRVPPATAALSFIRVKQSQPFMNIVAQLSRLATRTTPTKVLPPASENRIKEGHNVLHRLRDHASIARGFHLRAYDLHRLHRGPPLYTYSPTSPRPYPSVMESEKIKSFPASIHHPGLLRVQFQSQLLNTYEAPGCQGAQASVDEKTFALVTASLWEVTAL